MDTQEMLSFAREMSSDRDQAHTQSQVYRKWSVSSSDDRSCSNADRAGLSLLSFPQTQSCNSGNLFPARAPSESSYPLGKVAGEGGAKECSSRRAAVDDRCEET